MNVLLFGATGMIGQGVLRECLLSESVKSVTVVVRSSLGQSHPKLREIIHRDFTDFSACAADFASADACFYCVGISSPGKTEQEYTVATHDYTIAAARAVPANPALTFVFVSAEGADPTEKGRIMWARVKGRTENALLAFPFRSYVFRFNFVQPMHGAVSQTQAYRVLYAVIGWMGPLLRHIMPGHYTTTENVGRAMIALARGADPGLRVLHSPDINRMADEWARV